MKLVYKDIDSLMKQIGNVLVKNRIEHATPPMNVDFKEQQIDSIEMDFGDNEQIIDDAMEIIKDETDGDISFDESNFDVATVNVEVRSIYFDEVISHKTDSGKDYTDVVYKPAFIMLDVDKLLEFRVNAFITCNLYDIKENTVDRILTKQDGIESEVNFEIDDVSYNVSFEEDYRQLAEDSFVGNGYRKQLRDAYVTKTAIIPIEINIARALEDELLIERLESKGIDVKNLDNRSCEIYINDEKLIYQNEYKTLLLSKILENVQYRNNYEVLNMFKEQIKGITNETSKKQFEALYQELNHNEKNLMDIVKTGIDIERETERIIADD